MKGYIMNKDNENDTPYVVGRINFAIPMNVVEVMQQSGKDYNVYVAKNSTETELAAKELIDFVMRKYDVKDESEFTCEYHKRLYRAIYGDKK